MRSISKLGSALRVLFHGRTLRRRLTFMYAGLFLGAAALLLILTVVLWQRTTAQVSFAVPVHVGQPISPDEFSQHAQQIAGDQHASDRTKLLIYSTVALGVMAFVSMGLGWWSAGRFVRPLRAIASTARDISASNLDERITLDDPDEEFGELRDTLNDLFARLRASFESQRHFVTNASHELRTPLTAERTLIQVALADPNADVATLRAMCEKLLVLEGQQERLIDGLLTLASSERGIEQRTVIGLAGVAKRVALGREPEADRRHIRIDTKFDAALVIGDPSLVESLIANLVDNAIRHNVAEGLVQIRTTTEAGRAKLLVSNTGAVIPEGEVERLFQPFQRLGQARTGRGGHGLGLAIVRAIANAHGATVTAHARPWGGLDIDVSFPVSKPGSKGGLGEETE